MNTFYIWLQDFEACRTEYLNTDFNMYISRFRYMLCNDFVFELGNYNLGNIVNYLKFRVAPIVFI